MNATQPIIGAQHHVLGSMSRIAMRDAHFEMLSLLIRDKDQAWRKQTEEKLLNIFNQWKTEHGSQTPMTYRGSTGLGKKIPIPFEAATPYECSESAADYVSFFFTLLRTKFPPLITLTETEDITDLLAVAAMIEPEMTLLSSLMQTISLCLGATIGEHSRTKERNSRLLSLLDELAPAIKRDAEARRQIIGVQPDGAAANKRKAAERRATLRKGAIDYFLANPYASVDECIAFLLSRGLEGTHRTIKDAISGCKQGALQKIRESTENKGQIRGK